MRALKQSLLSLFVRFLQHPSVQPELDRQFRLRRQQLPPLENVEAPYSGLGQPATQHTENAPETMAAPVFITSRFRSGSTLLWNLFRQLDNCTAYYEPFNERQWFNASLRGERVDETHKGVSDYWREYAGMDDLKHWYREDWIREALYMDAQSWDPAMRQYLRALVDRAHGRAVLQFNRVDFRLAWLRRHFPAAPIVHLYRHPREQWLSFLTDKQAMSAGQVEHTYRDGFYLNSWCEDLAKHYPFLSREHTPHPYRRFYYLWKLSYLHGRHHATFSLAFETLVSEPEASLRELLDAIAWDGPVDLAALSAPYSAPPLERWRDYASEAWFAEHEHACEAELDSFLATPRARHDAQRQVSNG